MLVSPTVVGSLGVGLLLTAFLLQLVRILDAQGTVYLALNFSGAMLACFASVMLDFMPFVVLEGVWALIALFGLLRALKTDGYQTPRVPVRAAKPKLPKSTPDKLPEI